MDQHVPSLRFRRCWWGSNREAIAQPDISLRPRSGSCRGSSKLAHMRGNIDARRLFCHLVGFFLFVRVAFPAISTRLPRSTVGL